MLKDQRGAAITVLVLLLIPFLLIGIFATTDFSKTVHDYDVSLQVGVSEAVRSAAFMVDKSTLAQGKPLINHTEAHNAFKKILFNRTPESQIENYTFVVYNGYGKGGKSYTYRKGSINPIENNIGEENDAVFSITTNNVFYGTGENSVTLKEPGCIAVVELKASGFIEKEKESGYRWAASTIILADDFY